MSVGESLGRELCMRAHRATGRRLDKKLSAERCAIVVFGIGGAYTSNSHLGAASPVAVERSFLDAALTARDMTGADDKVRSRPDAQHPGRGSGTYGRDLPAEQARVRIVLCLDENAEKVM